MEVAQPPAAPSTSSYALPAEFSCTASPTPGPSSPRLDQIAGQAARHAAAAAVAQVRTLASLNIEQQQQQQSITNPHNVYMSGGRGLTAVMETNEDPRTPTRSSIETGRSEQAGQSQHDDSMNSNVDSSTASSNVTPVAPTRAGAASSASVAALEASASLHDQVRPNEKGKGRQVIDDADASDVVEDSIECTAESQMPTARLDGAPRASEAERHAGNTMSTPAVAGPAVAAPGDRDSPAPAEDVPLHTPPNLSGASSPDVDSDRPLNSVSSTALQRGDSTSSDSSVSGLSRASSSSSVYATPFRMTPFRTPATQSRAGSYVGDRSSYFPRFARGLTGGSTTALGGAAGSGAPMMGQQGSTSGRNSITAASAPVLLPAGVRTAADGPSSMPHGIAAATANAHAIAMHVLGADNAAGSGSAVPRARSVDHGHSNLMYESTTTAPAAISPAAAYAASVNRTPRPPCITLPGNEPASPIASSYPPAVQAPMMNGSSSNQSISQLRPPPSPGADLLIQAAMRPQRPGLGSRTASQASIGVNFHKRASDFELGEVLGEGSYSTVFLATDKHPPHRTYALKVLDKKHIIKERKVKYVNVEKDTLARLDRHPGIVRLYWTFHDEQSLYFVLELASNGEILKYIKDYGSFDTVSARFYAAQLLSALEHMHRKGVIHRDVKPENILLDANMRIKVTDFGTAKLISSSPTSETRELRYRFIPQPLQYPRSLKEEPLTIGERLAAEDMHSRSNSFVGTAQYVSPELLTAKPTTSTTSRKGDGKAAVQVSQPPPPACADFWAFGCVLYQFITGRTPFRAPNEYLIFQKITKLEYDFPDDFPEDAKDLVSRLLVLDPLQRLGAKNGAEEIKAHRFFDSVDWANIWTCDPPPIKTGITQPTVFPKQILALEESSHDDDASDEAELESLATEGDAPRASLDGQAETRDAKGGLARSRATSRAAAPPLPDMLPPASPIAARRRLSSAGASGKGSVSTGNDVQFPSSFTSLSAGMSGYNAAGRESHRSSISSAGVASVPGSAASFGSMQRDQAQYLSASTNSVSPQNSLDLQHSRSRSSSTSGRWSKFLSMPRNALQRVKAPTSKRRSSPQTGESPQQQR